jgi:hypothetical protein
MVFWLDFGKKVAFVRIASSSCMYYVGNPSKSILTSKNFGCSGLPESEITKGKKKRVHYIYAGLSDGIFSFQKSRFGSILEGLGTECVGMYII